MSEQRIKIVVDPSGAESGARRVNASLGSMGSAASGVGRTFASLGAAGAGIFAALIPHVISVNREFGRLKAMLHTVTGSADGAAKAFSSLERFAASTPFTLDQSVNAFIRLKSLGLDPSERSLRSYGNTAAATGRSMMQFVEAVADATTGEFQRLRDFGIRASKEGDRIRFTFQGVTTEVANTSKDIEGYLRGIGETTFGDAMSNQMKTLDGSISNLEDSFAGLMRAIGEVGATDGIQWFTTKASNAMQVLQLQILGTARIWRESGLSGALGTSFSNRQLSATATGRRDVLEQDVNRLFLEAQALDRRGGSRSLNPLVAAGANAAQERLRRAEAALARFNRENLDSMLRESPGSKLLPGFDPFARPPPPPPGADGPTAEELSARASAAKARATAERSIAEAVERTLAAAEKEAEFARLIAEGREIEVEMYRITAGLARDLTDAEQERLRTAIELRAVYEGIADTMSNMEKLWREMRPTAVNPDPLRRSVDAIGEPEDVGPAAEALGQIIGGRAGSAITKAAGVIQGLSSGDFTGVGGKLGGTLTLLSQKSGRQGAGALTEGIREAFRQPVKSFKETGDILSGAFKSGGGFEKLLGKAGGGAATGTAVAGIGNALGIKMSSTGAQIGGAIGSFIPIPGGEIIGSIVGGLLGGIGPTPRAYSNLNVGPDGNIVVSSGGARGSGAAGNRAASAQAADSVSEALMSIIGAVGGDLRAGSTIGAIGPVGDRFAFATTGAVRGSNKQAISFSTAEEAAEGLIRSVFSRGLVEGIDSFTQRVLSSSRSLESAVDLAARYETALDLIEDRADPLGAAARDATGQIDDLIREMQSFGATALEIGKIEGLRTQALKDALDQQLASLRSFQSALSGEGSGETSLTRLSTALADYDRQRAMIGQAGFDQGAFTQAGQQVFGLARDVFGTSTDQFQEIRQRLIADTSNAITATESSFNAAAAASAPVVNAIQDQTQVALQGYQAQLQGNLLLQQILAAIPGAGVGAANDAWGWNGTLGATVL